MMVLVTGTPGAGKTLNTIKNVYEEVQKNPFFEKKGEDGIIEKYKREVYSCNINGIDTEKSGFKILEDPTKWTSLPAGSILIIDEASDFYPTSKKFGDDLEKDVAELRKHRHYGIDIYYITQQPGLINKNIRILCGLHRHYQRNFGGKTTISYEQNAVFETDSKFLNYAEQNGAKKSTVILDKKYFGFYKSTEIDTHKSKLPILTLFLKLGLPIIGLIVCVVFLFSSFTDSKEDHKKSKPTSEIQLNQLADSAFSSSSKKSISKEEYQDSFKPRLPFVQETAPIYDEVYQVVTYPKLKGCYKQSNDDSSCECFTQQGTIYKLPIKICLDYIGGNRRFDYAKPDKQSIY